VNGEARCDLYSRAARLTVAFDGEAAMRGFIIQHAAATGQILTREYLDELVWYFMTDHTKDVGWGSMFTKSESENPFLGDY
jgi:hypothetical protein